MSSYKAPFTTLGRLHYLEKAEDDLNHRTDLKFSSGCGETGKELSIVQKRILAQVYGIRGLHQDQENSNHLFRWLLAHVGHSKNDFLIKKPSHKQWERIIGKYFQSNGHYAEVAILERLLLTVLRAKKHIILSDAFLADRIGDYNMKTDWIFHIDQPHGDIKMGIQVSAANHVVSKVSEILSGPTSDISVFEKSHSEMVSQFLRHGMGVLAFPLFQSSESGRKERKMDVLRGARTYQSKLVNKDDSNFSQYGRWVLDMLNAFNEGVKERVIDRFSHAHNVSYDYATKEGNTIKVELKKIKGEHVAMLEFYIKGAPKASSRPVVFAVPLKADFLDTYRDMAGIRAQ